MAVVPIVKHPDHKLQTACLAIEPDFMNAAGTMDTIRDLLDTAEDAAKGTRGCIGLAAPQIGRLLRIVVVQMPDNTWRVMLNPEIRRRARPMKVMEGCLSIEEPKMAHIFRPTSITYAYTDPKGKQHKEVAGGYLAQVIQHETDHLDGKLFIDLVGATAI